MATATLGKGKAKVAVPKKEEAVTATDAGVEAPAAPEPFYAGGEITTKLASSISFAPIDPGLDPEARKERVRVLLHQSADAGGKLEILQGELLFEANTNGYWQTWFFEDSQGKKRCYADWDEFAREELGMSRRTSFTRIDLYKTFVLKLKVPEDVLSKLEWSKAGLVTKLLTEENWPNVLDKISGLSYSKVNDFVKEAKNTADVEQAFANVTAPKAITGPTDAGVTTPSGSKADKEDGFKTFKLNLSAAQFENVTNAIGVCMKAVSTDSQAHAMDIICSEYLTGNPGDMNKMDILANLVRSIESNFGAVVEIKSVPDDLTDE